MFYDQITIYTSITIENMSLGETLSSNVSSKQKLTKNEKRRQKKKAEKKAAQERAKTGEPPKSESKETPSLELIEGEGEVEVEYVSASLSDIGLNDPTLEEFKLIFQKFSTPEELTSLVPVNEENEVEVLKETNDQIEVTAEGTVDEPKKISKKKKKLMSRLSVAELKQLVQRPDVVEAHDVTASDPRLLVYLKAYRNTVPVPRHWCHKRKYLQGKRGIEKTPFELPEFIAETGIAKIRESVLEQEALKKGSRKARDKLQPKMGRIDIDYQVSKLVNE